MVARRRSADAAPMTRKHLRALAALTFVALSVLAPAARAVEHPKEWSLRYSTSMDPRTYHPFSLYSQWVNQEVRYGSREYGINLVWSPGTTREWRLQRCCSWETGAIKWGEPLALWNETNRKWVKYGERDNGINLVWSDTPVYEWSIRAGTIGTVATRSSSLALYNAVERDYVVYGERACGINLRWYDDIGGTYQSPQEFWGWC
jgi:hypothetical protein